MWEILGKGSIKSSKDGGDDLEAEKVCRECIKLFKVQFEGNRNEGEVELQYHGDGPYPKEVLDTTSCFILDCVSEIYPWTGKKANTKLRNATVAKAKQLAEQRPFWVADVDRQLEVLLFSFFSFFSLFFSFFLFFLFFSFFSFFSFSTPLPSPPLPYFFFYSILTFSLSPSSFLLLIPSLFPPSPLYLPPSLPSPPLPST